MVMPKDYDTRREKARNLRYKRGALNSLGSAFLRKRLEEITEACDDVRYFLDADGDADDAALLDALDGDEEEAIEFKMMFAELAADVQRVYDGIEMWGGVSYDDYDDCTLGLAGLEDRMYDDVTAGMMGRVWPDGITGYDTYEEDYYGMVGPYDGELVEKECIKRLMSKTKKEMVEAISHSWRVFLVFFDLDQRYRHLEATMSILRGDNAAQLSVIRDIEAKYEAMMKPWDPVYRLLDRKAEAVFDRLLNELPDRCWVE